MPHDAEITQLEQRIYLHRIGLHLSLEAAKDALRQRMSSPAALIGAVATGVVLERLTRHQPQDAPSTASRMGGVVAEAVRTGLKFLQSSAGMWVTSLLAARHHGEDEPEHDSASPVLH
jgi:small ligand-binding sensory domain FIST